jgi:S1-C subfamily serine protease
VALVIVIILAAIGAGIWIGHGVWTSGPSKAVARDSKTSSSVAAKVDPGLVGVNTTLGYEDEASAGIGMVLTSSGMVLTNNHVVDGATAISGHDPARVGGHFRPGARHRSSSPRGLRPERVRGRHAGSTPSLHCQP